MIPLVDRMIKMILYKATLLVFLTLHVTFVAAQNGTRVKASVDKSQVLIGEHILLKLEADIPENEVISFFSIDTIPHFEILQKEKIDTSNTSTGTLLTQTIRLTSFDSGHWVIPSFVLVEKLATDSLPMDIGFSSPFDPNQEYHDIKDVMDVELEKESDWWWWYAAGGALLVIILILWLLLRKKPAPPKVEEKPINAYEEAIRELELLQKQKADSKTYYSSLVDIFRLYVARKKGISSLQKTTDDLVVQLKELDLEKNSFEKLSKALRLSDFVKFAKYQPAPDDDRIAWETIRESIISIEKSAPALSVSTR